MNDRHEERFDFLLYEFVPVYAVEPRMRLDVGHMLHSLIRHFREQFIEEVFQVVAPLFVQIGLLVFDLIEEVASVFGVKWWKSMHQLIDDRTQTPPIHCFPMSFLLYHLRCQVLRRPTYRKSIIISEYIVLGESKVSEFDVPISPNQHILRL